MSITTTPNLGLIKSAYNTEKDDWGTHINDSFDLVDANVPVLLSSGTLSAAILNLTLPSAYRGWELRLKGIRSVYSTGPKLFARLSVAGVYAGSGYGYNYTGADGAGAVSGSATGATQANLTSAMAQNANGQGVIRISSQSYSGTYSNILGSEFEYVAPSGLGVVRAAGNLAAPAGHIDGIHLGLDAFGAGFDKGFDARYALFGLPGLV